VCSADASRDVIQTLLPLLHSCSTRIAACSALWAIIYEAADVQHAGSAFDDWNCSVLGMQCSDDLADVIAGLALSITSASRQQLFVRLHVLQLLLALLRAHAPPLHHHSDSCHAHVTHRSVAPLELPGGYAASSGSGAVWRNLLAVALRLCEDWTTADDDVPHAQRAIVSSELLPLIVSLCCARCLPEADLEPLIRILSLLSVRFSAELHALGVFSIMLRLLRGLHQDAVVSVLLCMGKMVCCCRFDVLQALQDSDAARLTVALLQSGSDDVRAWACWATLQLISRLGGSVFAGLCGADICAELLPLTHSPHPHTRRQAFSALCAATAASYTNRGSSQRWCDRLLSTGSEEQLLLLLDSMIRIFAVGQGALQEVLEFFSVAGVRLLGGSCATVLQRVCTLISTVAAASHLVAAQGALQAFLEHGAAAALVHLAQNDNTLLQIAAVDAITCLALSSRVCQQLLGSDDCASAVCGRCAAA
jgi:hypothetical protein